MQYHTQPHWQFPGTGVVQGSFPTGASLATPTFELEILCGKARRKRRPVNVPAFLVGIARDCDLVLADDQFPDAYAYLLLRQHGVLIRHLGFAPQLLVNDEPVTQAWLNDADVLQMGPFRLLVHVRPQDVRPPQSLHRDSSLQSRGKEQEKASSCAVSPAEVLAEAFDLFRCVREDVLGQRSKLRVYLGPENHLSMMPSSVTLPVTSAAFGRTQDPQARSA